MTWINRLLCNYLPKLLLIALALGLLLLAFFSFELGLDNNTGWGPFRRSFLILGVTILVGLSANTYWDRIRIRAPRLHLAVRAFVDQQPAIDGLRRFLSTLNQRSRYLDWKAHRSMDSARMIVGTSMVILVVISVIALYVWFVSVGNWTRWPSTTSYYNMLPEAFWNGQTNLLQEPDPRLAEIANPYSAESRTGIPIITDASYYEGKYYFYWGPVPALFILVANIAGVDTVGDHVIVFVAALMVLVFSVLIIFRV